MVKSNYVNLNLSISEILRKVLTLRKKGGCKNKNTYGAVAVAIDNLNEVDVELDWIQKAKENVDFLNANMLNFSIQFKVTRRNWSLNYPGGVG
jgi:hypothetical protein